MATAKVVESKEPAVTMTADLSPLLAAYDSGRLGHVSKVQAEHSKAAALGLGLSQNFTLPDIEKGFCNSWAADKALIDGAMLLINLQFPRVAIVIRGLVAVGDKLETTACHLPPEK